MFNGYRSVKMAVGVGALASVLAACAHAEKRVDNPTTQIQAVFDSEKGAFVIVDEKGNPLPSFSIKEQPIRESEVRAVEPFTVLRTYTNPSCIYFLSSGTYQKKCF
jgi:hypothetical protein